MFEYVGYGLGDSFEDDITKRDWSVVTRLSGVILLRYEADVSLIERSGIPPIVEHIKSGFAHISLDSIPVCVIKNCRQTIRARGSQTFHAGDGLSDLFSCELSFQVIVDIWGNSVLDNLNSSRDV
jgi:hypothetical protein